LKLCLVSGFGFSTAVDAVHPGLAREWLLQLLSATAADIVAGTVHYDGEAAPFQPVCCGNSGRRSSHGSRIRRRSCADECCSRPEGSMNNGVSPWIFDLWLRLLLKDARV